MAERDKPQAAGKQQQKLRLLKEDLNSCAPTGFTCLQHSLYYSARVKTRPDVGVCCWDAAEQLIPWFPPAVVHFHLCQNCPWASSVTWKRDRLCPCQAISALWDCVGLELDVGLPVHSENWEQVRGSISSSSLQDDRLQNGGEGDNMGYTWLWFSLLSVCIRA